MIKIEDVKAINDNYKSDKQIIVEAVLSQYNDEDTLEIAELKVLAKKYSHLTTKRFRRMLTSQLDSYLLSSLTFESY